MVEAEEIRDVTSDCMAWERLVASVQMVEIVPLISLALQKTVGTVTYEVPWPIDVVYILLRGRKYHHNWLQA